MLKSEKLIKLLDVWIEILKSNEGEKHWINWLEKDVYLLKNNDFNGIPHFLSAFGGMGSLTDYMYSFEQKNENVSDIISQAYDLAKEIEREHISSETKS